MSDTVTVTRMAPGEAYEAEALQGWALQSYAPMAGPERAVDLLFVHGMAAGGWMWTPDWLRGFTSQGYRCWTVTLPGRDAGATMASDPMAIDRVLAKALQGGDPSGALKALGEILPGASMFDGPSLDDFTDTFTDCLTQIGRPVVPVCHSLGGAVAQNYLRKGGRPAGTVLLCSVPPYGLWRASMEMALTNPELFATLSDFSLMGLAGTNIGVLRKNLFPSGISDRDFGEIVPRLRDESLKAMMQSLGWPPFAPFPGPRADMLVIGGDKDRLVPFWDVVMTAAYYGTQPKLIPGGGHMLMQEAVADKAITAIADFAAKLS
ncbi:MAG: alpha/beta hydrolase [Mangrovicoccus sp.]